MSLICLAAVSLVQAASADTGCKVSLPDRTAAAAKAAPAFYDQKADAAAAMAAALADAAQSGRSAVLVFGADWCHDSVALAKVLTSDAFRSEFGPGYSVTFIDVGIPQRGQGRNINLLARFKVKELKGTPAMFVVGPGGKLRNKRKDALSWRNAESRGAAATLDWFRKLKR
ncbi:MAG: thioredoxin family protein [Novosphingobium sp.]